MEDDGRQSRRNDFVYGAVTPQLIEQDATDSLPLNQKEISQKLYLPFDWRNAKRTPGQTLRGEFLVVDVQKIPLPFPAFFSEPLYHFPTKHRPGHHPAQHDRNRLWSIHGAPSPSRKKTSIGMPPDDLLFLQSAKHPERRPMRRVKFLTQ